MKRLKKLLILVAGIYLTFGIVVFIFQRKFIYFPTPQEFNSCNNLPDATPVKYEGTRMYIHKATNNWIIIYHGNAGSACDRSYYLNYFDTKNFSYIIVEYAGYSNDNSSPSQSALIKNVEAVDSYLKNNNPATVAIIGESLGTALAAYHSNISPPNRLLLISPFGSLSSVSQSHYWFFPTAFMLLDKYPSEQWVRNANNVLIIHGTHDSIIPIKFGMSLFQRILGTNKKMVPVPDAGHNDIFNYPIASDAISDFLK